MTHLRKACGYEQGQANLYLELDLFATLRIQPYATNTESIVDPSRSWWQQKEQLVVYKNRSSQSCRSPSPTANVLPSIITQLLASHHFQSPNSHHDLFYHRRYFPRGFHSGCTYAYP
jgi:hypothetical protein